LPSVLAQCSSHTTQHPACACQNKQQTFKNITNFQKKFQPNQSNKIKVCSGGLQPRDWIVKRQKYKLINDDKLGKKVLHSKQIYIMESAASSLEANYWQMKKVRCDRSTVGITNYDSFKFTLKCT